MRQYAPGAPLVFSHIPKTAGTSLRSALRHALRPAVVVDGLDMSLFGGYDDLDSVRPGMRSLIYRAPEELPADATLVAAHIAPGTTTVRYPGADHITVLRVPQVRTVSQWLHSRSVSEWDLRHWGPSAEAFRVGRLPLVDYLDHRSIAPSIDNTITRFLAWPHPALTRTEFLDERHDDELVAAAIERLERFAFVDLVENPQFMTRLATWLGRDVPVEQLNERTAVPPARRPDLVAEFEAAATLLEARCRLDVRVWRHVVARVLPGTDADLLLAGTVERTLARYAAMLQQPVRARLRRRVVERVYDTRHRVLSGSRLGVSAEGVARR